MGLVGLALLIGLGVFQSDLKGRRIYIPSVL